MISGTWNTDAILDVHDLNSDLSCAELRSPCKVGSEMPCKEKKCQVPILWGLIESWRRENWRSEILYLISVESWRIMT